MNKPEYWNAITQTREIFANLFSLEGHQAVEKMDFLRKYFPELIASFEALEFYAY